VAHALGRPTVSGIKGIKIEDSGLKLRRDTPSGSEVYQVPMPAVVAVKEGINLPRYPTLKGRLNAKKVELRRLSQAMTGSGQKMIRLVSPDVEVSKTAILGTGPDAASAVVDVLEELQVLGS